jgi:hypothetical protein
VATHPPLLHALRATQTHSPTIALHSTGHTDRPRLVAPSLLCHEAVLRICPSTFFFFVVFFHYKIFMHEDIIRAR